MKNEKCVNITGLDTLDMPQIVRLELSNTCNLSCPHCRHHSPQKKADDNYEYYRRPIHMTEEEAGSIIEEVAPYKASFTLNAANEPLTAKAQLFAIRKVKELGLAGLFNTNGLLLTEKIARFLVDIEFDSVNFSIDAMTPETLKKARGISTLDKLIEKVELLINERGERMFPRIGVTFVKMDYSYHEIPAFLEFWKKRVDVIRISGFIKALRPDISILPGTTKEDLPERVPCKQLFREILIRANGDVTPCVISAERTNIVVGNIFKDGGVRSVWHGKNMQKLRELHNSYKWGQISYCAQCDFWVESFDMKDEERDGFLIRTPSPYTTFYNVKEKLDNWNKNLHDRQGMAGLS
nr:SPASM domain-containing protein [Bacteroidota bacterium]